MNTPRCWIEINKTFLINNIKSLKQASNSGISVVVKNNAYGCSMIECAKICNNLDFVHSLSVAFSSEAYELIKIGITKKILILSYLDEYIEENILNNSEFVVYEKYQLEQLDFIAQKLFVKAKIHIKIDTGMCRLGVWYEKDFYDFLDQIKNYKNLQLVGLCTHLSDSSNIDPTYNRLQLNRFNTCIEIAKNNGFNNFETHGISSSGLISTKEYKYDFIRAGSLCYGLFKGGAYDLMIKSEFPELILKNITEFKSKIAQIKIVPKNEPVGYSKTFITKRQTVIGVLPIGYWDGYPRFCANKSVVIVNNQKAPVIGNISMSLTTIDLTDVKDFNYDQEVLILGSHKAVSQSKLAHLGNTNSNEINSRLSEKIKRFIVE